MINALIIIFSVVAIANILLVILIDKYVVKLDD